ncbi:FABP4 [Branchiostoma lanceolatum]|uniref:FABP4 protein n=1 Tax=Branchiostoma lanceolatum TaxID=7740 RepID=A0A8J9YW47_BRALA|nr:FABP4 [Branchiostoma lanceolatum]
MSITDINGSWKVSSHDNFEAFLTEAGIPEAHWEHMKTGSAKYTVTQDGDSVTLVEADTDGKHTATNTFKLGQEFDKKGIDGKSRKATITFSGGVLTITVPDMGNGKKGVFTKQPSGDTMTETFSIGSVSGKLIYKKA